MSPRATDVLSAAVVIAGAVATVATSYDPPYCEADEDCPAMCQQAIEQAESLDEEIANAPRPDLTATRCYLGSTTLGIEGSNETVSQRPHCECEVAGRTPYVLWGDYDYCLVIARDGQCLLDASELPLDLCTSGLATTCDAVCEDLEDRLAADATRVVERTLVDSRCDYSCYCTLDIDGTCFEANGHGGWGLGGPRPDDEVPCP